MKKTIFNKLFFVLSIILTGMQLNARIPIILDTDANNELDDQHAIAYMLFSSDIFDVKGITVNYTEVGDINAHYAEAERIMKFSKANGIIPLKKGAQSTYLKIKSQVFNASFDGKDAVDFIIEQAHAYDGSEGKLILAPIGKITNIALAFHKDPSIINKVRVMWLGGHYDGENVSDYEFNLRHDPDAYNAVILSGVQFEMFTVRSNEPSGTAAVRVHIDEIREKMPAVGPYIPGGVVGRTGGTFYHWGDYSIELFEQKTTTDRALFDLCVLSILKNPTYANPRTIPAPKICTNKWCGVHTGYSITIWEWFNRDAIINDFFNVMYNPILVEEKASQSITFNTIPDKYINSPDFNITASASSGLPVTLSIVSGPASISGNTISLNGTSGTVSVIAVQDGDDNYNAATPVIRSFNVLELHSVNITTPYNGESFLEDAEILIQADVINQEGLTNKVEFYAGTTKLGEDNTAPYSFNWTNVSSGSYVLTAKSTDTNGESATSSAVNINVLSYSTLPNKIVSVIAPPSVATSEFVTVNVTYSASSERDLYVNFQLDHTPYTLYSEFKLDVSPGSSTIPVTFQIPAGVPVANNDYQFQTFITIDGGGWTERLSNISIKDISVTQGTLSTSLAASVISSNQINLTWSDVFDNENGYIIERKSGSSNYTQIANLPANTTSYSDAGLTESTTYTYRVYAYNSNGNFDYSNEVTATTLTSVNTEPTVSITSPSNGATYNEGDNITISANASDADGGITKVEFYNGATKLGEDVSSPYSFTWNNVTAGSYQLTAKATDNENSVGVSTTVNIEVVLNIPDAPSTLVANTVSTSQIDLTWSDNADNETGYIVERKSGSSNFAQIASIAANTQNYSDAGLTTNTTYTYRVMAYNSEGNSAYSNESSATTQAVINDTTEGLLAQWLFEGNGDDATGNGHTLSLQNGVSFNADAKEGNMSVNLDGQDDQLALDYGDFKAAFSTRTITMWINPVNTTGIQTLYEEGGSWKGLVIRINNGNIEARLREDNQYNLDISANFNYTGWTHIGLVFDAGSLNLYINGILVNTANNSNVSIVNSHSDVAGIGFTNSQDSYMSGTINNFGGLMDDVRIYTEALTENQIVQTMGLTGNTLPVVNLTSPLNGTSYNAGDNITIQATANDTDGSITKVEFFAGTTKLGEDVSSPYSYTWNNVTAGAYQLTAKATDNENSVGVSTAVNIEVILNTPDAPSILAANTLSTSQIDLTWSDNADNETGFILERKTGSENFIQVADLPANTENYSDIELPENTSYTYRVYAYNNDGNSIYSNEASATTLSSANIQPTVSITSPSNGVTVDEGDAVLITATASDADGTISKVSFYVSGSKIGEDATAPYSYEWSNIAAGTYTITVEATDDNEATATDQVIIYVNGTSNPALMAHWTFDETSGVIASDVIGTLDGTLTNGPVWRPDLGINGGALEFDGSNDLVHIGYPDLAQTELTLAAWIKIDDFGVSDARIISKAVDVDESDHYWMLSTFSSGRLRFRLKANGTTKTLLSSSNVLITGQWIHVAATFDGNLMKVFVNGNEAGSLSNPGTITTTNAVPAAIGNQPQGGRPFDGLMDDVRIYSEALTSSQLSELMSLSTISDFKSDNTGASSIEINKPLEISPESKIVYIYPTITSGDITIKGASNSTLKVYNNLGIIVASKTIKSDSENFLFDLPVGIYYFIVQKANGVKEQFKIIKF